MDDFESDSSQNIAYDLRSHRRRNPYVVGNKGTRPGPLSTRSASGPGRLTHSEHMEEIPLARRSTRHSLWQNFASIKLSSSSLPKWMDQSREEALEEEEEKEPDQEEEGSTLSRNIDFLSRLLRARLTTIAPTFMHNIDHLADVVDELENPSLVRTGSR